MHIQCLGLLCSSLRLSYFPRTPLLETSYIPNELYPSRNVHAYGGFHTWRRGRFLREHHRHPSAAYYRWGFLGTHIVHLPIQGMLSLYMRK